MAVFFCAGSTDSLSGKISRNFCCLFSKFFLHRFSGADSAKAGKIRTALFPHPGKMNRIFSGSRIVFDFCFINDQTYSSFSQQIVNKVF